jgi:hypothetical protein
MFNDPAFVNVLRPTLAEFRLKEPTLYLLYPDRKHVPFKARAFIDLVLESGAKQGEQTSTAFAANRIRLAGATSAAGGGELVSCPSDS